MQELKGNCETEVNPNMRIFCLAMTVLLILIFAGFAILVALATGGSGS